MKIKIDTLANMSQVIRDEKENIVAYISQSELGNKKMSFLVRAVNSHEALLEASKTASAALGNIQLEGDEIGREVTKEQLKRAMLDLRRAIEQAEANA